MAGVAGPMLRRSRAAGARFLAGLLAGGAAGALVLALPVYLLGMLAGLLPQSARLVILLVTCALLGLADLSGRTPHMWRQVPQQLVNRLPPGALGLAWGFDLGLMVTTQKTTSLIWGTIAAVVLLRPSLAAPALVGIATVATLTVVLFSAGGIEPEARRSKRWLMYARRSSGAVMLTALLAGLLA
ncbi:MAG TPA: hypothetical protein VF062_00490 [Candidatus Limnocylindrales bacterium]